MLRRTVVGHFSAHNLRIQAASLSPIVGDPESDALYQLDNIYWLAGENHNTRASNI
jgi:hypothetical protein